MKAITVKFFGPGNVRGSRFRVSDGDGNTIYVSSDPALGHEENRDAAALELCRKMGWTQHGLVRGWAGKAMVYTFDAPMNKVPMEVTGNLPAAKSREARQIGGRP